MNSDFSAMNEPVTSLRNLLPDTLSEWLGAKGYPAYRGHQIFQWLWQHHLESPDEMTNIPKSLRALLAAEGNLALLETAGGSESALNETRKLLFKLQDGHFIESVLIVAGGRRTVCVSSQVGCALGCTFCQTGKMGFIRHLSSGEIADQVRQINKISRFPVTNVVFMGMGEPFLNYENVITAAQIMNHDEGLNIGARKITLSTSGIIPRIADFAALPFQYKLAISLNAIFDNLRCEIMPITKKYDLNQLLEAAKKYTETSNKLVTFEYVMLRGINTRQEDADELIRRLSGIPCKLNLIPFNETDSQYIRPLQRDINEFESRLQDRAPFPVMVRWSGGTDINAACGQLYTQQIKKAIK